MQEAKIGMWKPSRGDGYLYSNEVDANFSNGIDGWNTFFESFLLENYVDVASKIYLFECDPVWIEALEKTFEPYKDKVVIVPKMFYKKTT